MYMATSSGVHGGGSPLRPGTCRVISRSTSSPPWPRMSRRSRNAATRSGARNHVGAPGFYRELRHQRQGRALSRPLWTRRTRLLPQQVLQG
jgi:hypothetical protein